MQTVERFDTWRQRDALTALSEPGFLESAEGAAFLEQLEAFFAPSTIAAARKMGYALEAGDVVSMLLVRLLENDGKIAAYAATADEPWRYIGGCLGGDWARREWGLRGTGLDMLEFNPPQEPSRSDLTPLGEVVDLAFETLAPLVESGLHDDLRDLLGWLAANPPQRLSYEAEAARAAHRVCPSFTIEQVIAVMNVAWGGRPRQAKTSVFGEFLVNPRFRPSDSPTHIRALTFFKNAMRAGAAGSKRLADWGSR